MATSAITSSIYQELQNFYQGRRADVQQLGNALQSGNLDAAKQAFSDLTALGQNGPFGNAEPFSKTARAQAFEAIGQALQTGDLAGAQAAFASLQGSGSSTARTAQQGSPAAIVNISATQNGDATGNVADTESIYQQLQTFREARKADITQLGTALRSGDATGAQQAYAALVALGKNGPNGNGQAFQRSDRAQAFDAIGTALSAGDLAGANQAFANLASSFGLRLPAPNEPPVTPPVTPNPTPGPVPEVIINLGGGGATPTPAPVDTTPVSPTPVPTPAPVDTTPATTPSTTPTNTPTPTPTTGPVPEVVINLGGANSQGGGATPEVVVNIASGNSSNSGNPAGTPEEIQINFGSNGSAGQLTIDVSQLPGNQPGEQVAINLNQPGGNSELIFNLFNSTVSSPASSSSSSSNSISSTSSLSLHA
jgi:hypothetical protein